MRKKRNTMRKKLELRDTLQDVMIKMAEGNPGALVVLMKIIEKDPVTGFGHILSMDDMNIRGCQIWVGYKDHCNENMENFLEAVKNRNPEMVKTINKHSGIEEMAVTNGASWR